MKITEIVEPESKTLGIMFGRFNPAHKGHKNAWKMLSKNDQWFVGTNKSTIGPKDPLPGEIKATVMETIMPELKGHLIFSQSWLSMAAELYEKFPDYTLKLYTDEDWVSKTINRYNGQPGTYGMYDFKKIEWIKTPRLSSATDLRTAVLDDDTKAFASAAGIPADTPIDVDGKRIAFFDLVKKYLEPYREKLAK